MKKIFGLLIGLLWASPLLAQVQVTVTGTVLGATSGYVQFVLQPQNTGVQFFVLNQGVVPITTTCSITTGGAVVGALSGPCLVWGNDVISPANTTYQVVYAPGGIISSRIPRMLITGTAYSLNNPVFGPVVNLVPQFQTVTTPPITTNIVPTSNNTFNLGAPGFFYSSGYISNLFTNQVCVGGNCNAFGVPGRCDASTQTGLDASFKISACANSLTSGGIITAEGIQGAQTWSICPTFPIAPITLLLGIGAAAIQNSCTIPSTVELNFPQGAELCPNSGKTLQINGPIDATAGQQIFCGAGLTITPKQLVASPQWWGAAANVVVLGGPIYGGLGCTGTSGQATITCSQGAFVVGDIGKKADLSHGGPAACGQQYWGVTGSTFSCNLVTTIIAVNSSSSVTLGANLGTSVSGEQFTYGTLDDIAINNAVNSGAIQVQFSGAYGVAGNIIKGTFQNQTFSSSSLGAGRLINIGPVTYGTQKGYMWLVDNGSANVTFQNLQFFGTNELGELNTFGATPDGLLICTGAPNGLSGGCNGQSGLNNVQILNCEFSYTWGIGAHQPGTGLSVGQQVIGLVVYNSRATWNAFDGFNLLPWDGLLMNNDVSLHNGTGGVESSSNGSFTITGGQFRYNRDVGISIGGFTDTEHTSTCNVTGNDVSENGNGFTTNTVGTGIVLSNGTWGCNITGNTVKHNHLIGIQLTGGAANQGKTNVSGNVVLSNGINGANNTSVGIYGGLDDAIIASNFIKNEGDNRIYSCTISGNVATISTILAHTYQVGYSVTIISSDGGLNTCDGTFTILSVPAFNTFTYALTHANAGPLFGGFAYSGGSGFTQQYGMEVFAAARMTIKDNTVFDNHSHNVNFENGNWFYSTFSTTSQNIKVSSDISFAGFTPSATGLLAIIPDIQTTVTACTTAASVGATCTVVITPVLGFSPNNTTCTLDNTPNAQTGVPVIVKVDTSTNSNQETVTIAALTAVAAGGGTMRCRTNFAY